MLGRPKDYMRHQVLRLATLQNTYPVCTLPVITASNTLIIEKSCNRRTARLLLYIGATFSPRAGDSEPSFLGKSTRQLVSSLLNAVATYLYLCACFPKHKAVSQPLACCRF